MWMPWQYAVICAVGLGGVAVAHPLWRLPRMPVWARPWVREAAVVFVLYAAWRRLGAVNVTGPEGAMDRGRDLYDLERALFLPDELTLQRWTLKATWLARTANWYYIVVHVVPVGVWLVWLFARHRDVYARWRNVFALSSLLVLVLQWVPVAPPRFYPELGFVDTGALLGPRVYDAAGAGTIHQLSAMPSMHVAWAAGIGLSVFFAARSRWRWLGPAHIVGTTWAVVVTGYHWLADGLVAIAVVALVALVLTWWDRRRAVAGGAVPAPARRSGPSPG